MPDKDFHQQVSLAVRETVGFYKRCGFKRAWRTEPMWIYRGSDA